MALADDLKNADSTLIVGVPFVVSEMCSLHTRI
jgi:hypothetical protein